MFFNIFFAFLVIFFNFLNVFLLIFDCFLFYIFVFLVISVLLKILLLSIFKQCFIILNLSIFKI